ncbi:MAG: ABC transporter substrate-binding protein [Janthinobacterium lividum]
MKLRQLAPPLLASAGLLGITSSALAANGLPLKIGTVLPLTGSYGTYGKGCSVGLQIALKEVNAAGGVLGKPVTLLSEDDQSDPTAGLNGAKKLIDADKVDIIVGTFASNVTLPILSYTTQVGIPVATLSGAPEISKIGKQTHLVYRFVATEGVFGEADALYARANGAKTAYVLAGNNAAQLDANKHFEARFTKEGGKVLGSTIYEPGQASYRSEAGKALAGKPDIVLLAAYTDDAVTLAKTLYQLSPQTKVVGPLYALNDTFIKAVGPTVAEGKLAIDAMSAENSPAYARVMPQYKQITGESPTSNPYAIIDYDMVITVALAAQAAGSTDPKVFTPFISKVANGPGKRVTSYEEGLAALKAGQSINYEGASSPVDFDDSGDLKSMMFKTFKLTGGKVVAQGTVAP